MNNATKNAPFGYVVADANTGAQIHFCRSFGWKFRATALKKAKQYTDATGVNTTVRLATENDRY